MGVTIKCRQVVRPAEPTWCGILPLSELDQTGFIAHTPIIYIYNKPTQNSVLGSSFSKTEIVESVKDSLSRVLVPFFPVAGRLSWADMGGRLELECNAYGTEFIEAESSHQVTDFGDFSSPYETMFDGLIPEVDYNNTPLHKLPILFVQLTWFRCGGIGIGASLSHVVADGQSLFHFFREFAKLTRDGNGLILDSIPYLNRRIIEDTISHNLGTRVINPDQRPREYSDVDQFTRLPIVIGEENDKEQRKIKTVTQNLVLSKEQTVTLKKIAENDNNSRVPYSRYEVIVSHIWRCASKARGHTTEQMTAVSLLFDSRARFSPPLPPSYFGDAVIIEVEQRRACELISSPQSHTCQKIRERKAKTMSEDYTRSAIKHLKAQNPVFKYKERAVFGGPQGVFFGNPNLAITSLLNFPMRGLDFGWGREVYMSTAMQRFDGYIIISPGYENDGSVVVSIGLQVQHLQEILLP